MTGWGGKLVVGREGLGSGEDCWMEAGWGGTQVYGGRTAGRTGRSRVIRGRTAGWMGEQGYQGEGRGEQGYQGECSGEQGYQGENLEGKNRADLGRGLQTM